MLTRHITVTASTDLHLYKMLKGHAEKMLELVIFQRTFCVSDVELDSDEDEEYSGGSDSDDSIEVKTFCWSCS